jgi:hypothetical protein
LASAPLLQDYKDAELKRGRLLSQQLEREPGMFLERAGKLITTERCGRPEPAFVLFLAAAVRQTGHNDFDMF